MRFLSNEDLVTQVLSIGSGSAIEKVSDKYRKVNTLDVVDTLRREGWLPFRARGVMCRSPARRQFCRHEIRFQQEGDALSERTLGGESINLILSNSHDGGSSYKIQLGVFRLVCLNGMVIQSRMCRDIRVRHVGFEHADIVQASREIGQSGVMISERIEAMKRITLPPTVIDSMANRAAALVLGEDKMQSGEVYVSPRAFAAPRRTEDNGSSLWQAFNRIQENATKGGIRYYKQDEDGRYGLPSRDGRYVRRRTSRINSIDRDQRINQALWAMTEEVMNEQ